MGELIGLPDKSQKGLFNELAKGWEMWQPDPIQERSPIITIENLEEAGFREVEKVDLNELKPGDLIYFICTNPHAFYTLRIEKEGKLKAWRDCSGRTSGLQASINDIITFDQKTVESDGSVLVYPGMLFARKIRRIQPRIFMPYFEFDEQEIVKNPQESWVDFIEGIFLKEASDIPNES